MLEQNDKCSLNRRYMTRRLADVSDTAAPGCPLWLAESRSSQLAPGLWIYTTRWDTTHGTDILEQCSEPAPRPCSGS